jgi:hypothetical protein
MLGQSVEQDAILKCGYFDHHDVGTYEMWAQIEGTRAVSLACNRKLCAQTLLYICVDAECMCQQSHN